MTDRRNASPCAGHLHHQIGLGHHLPQSPCFPDRLLGVGGDIGRNLKAYIAVFAAEAVVHRPQIRGGCLDVRRRLAFVGISDARVGLAEEASETLVIGVPMAHRLLEDRGVGGDAGQTVLLNQLAQPAFVKKFAVYEV